MITREAWGSAGGQPVDLFTLSGSGGMTVTVSSFGGVVQSVRVPDRSGRLVNVALGFASLEEYVDNVSSADIAFFGAIIGRYANRIAGRSFTLDGRRYELSGNDGPGNEVTLHGGPDSYHAQVWQTVLSGDSLHLSYVDPDGRNGFPGTVWNDVVYEVSADNALRIELCARSDAPTVVSLTNHTYFNLAGEGSGDVYDQLLAINGALIQRVDSAGIPVGFATVAGTPFDFRAMKPIGHDIRDVEAVYGEQLAQAGGYDHNWVLRGTGYRLAAVACDPRTGIAMWTYTDRPGMQFYTANSLAGDRVGTSGRVYRKGDAFALETQAFPDTPNHVGEPGWPNVVLRPGEMLRTRTAYKFGLAEPGLAERVRF